jgi:hypothetical protein
MPKKDDMGHMKALLGLGASANPGVHRDPGFSRPAGPNRDPGFTRPAGPNRDPGFTRSVKSLTSMTKKK